MPPLVAGTRVRHPEWGCGTLLQKQAFGRAKVRFDEARRLPRSVRRRDLEILRPEVGADASDLPDEGALRIAPGAESERTVPSPGEQETARGRPSLASSSGARPATHSPPASPRPFVLTPEQAWQTLEALRLGVVPANGAQAYTVARERQIEQIDGVLEEAHGFRVIWGDYGAGKTHLLDIAEQHCLERGFAVSRVTLDPKDNALHQPLNLYRAVYEKMRSRDFSGDCFESLCELLVDSPEHLDRASPKFSRFFSPLIHALREGRGDEIDWLRDYARGDRIASEDANRILNRSRYPGPNVLAMSPYRTYGRMYTHLVGNLAAWCRDAGLQGLVLLFDEVERLEALDRANRHYGVEVLKHFAAATLPETHMAFDPEDLYKGGQSVHRNLPIRYAEDQPLVMISALTPLEEVRAEYAGITTSSRYDVLLEPPGRAEIGKLLERLAVLYRRAYSEFPIEPALLGEIHRRINDAVEDGHDSFRAMVRAAVFLLDAQRHRRRVG